MGSSASTTTNKHCTGDVVVTLPQPANENQDEPQISPTEPSPVEKINETPNSKSRFREENRNSPHAQNSSKQTQSETQEVISSSFLDETLNAKDNQIRRLESELAQERAEVQALRIKSKRRLRQAAVKLTESKQSASIRIMELRQEISRLTEENVELKARLSSDKPEEVGSVSLDDSSHRNKLVLELSSQLNEQTEKITQLERNLGERDRLIERLESKLMRPRESPRSAPPTRQTSGQSRDSGMDSGWPDRGASFASSLSVLSEDSDSAAEDDKSGAVAPASTSIIFDPDKEWTIDQLLDT